MGGSSPYHLVHIVSTPGGTVPKPFTCEESSFGFSFNGGNVIHHDLVDLVGDLGIVVIADSPKRQLWSEVSFILLSPVGVAVIVPISVQAGVIHISGDIGIRLLAAGKVHIEATMGDHICVRSQ